MIQTIDVGQYESFTVLKAVGASTTWLLRGLPHQNNPNSSEDEWRVVLYMNFWPYNEQSYKEQRESGAPLYSCVCPPRCFGAQHDRHEYWRHLIFELYWAHQSSIEDIMVARQKQILRTSTVLNWFIAMPPTSQLTPAATHQQFGPHLLLVVAGWFHPQRWSRCI